jgi:hypothetical protein
MVGRSIQVLSRTCEPAGPPSAWVYAPRFSSLTSFLHIPKQSRQERIPKDQSETYPELVSPDPALAGFPRYLPSFHDRSQTRTASIWTFTKRGRFWRAIGRASSIRIRHDLPSGHIDPVTLHPLPIFLIQFRPFGTELQPSIAGFDIIDPLAGGSDSGRHTGVRPSTGRIPPPRSRRKDLAFIVRCTDASGSHLLARHEGQKTDQDCGHFPGWIKGLGVEIADTKAKSRRRLKAAAGSVHTYCRRRKRILRGEDQRAPILAIFIWSLWRASEYVMPSSHDQSIGINIRTIRSALTLRCWTRRDVRQCKVEDFFVYFDIHA